MCQVESVVQADSTPSSVPLSTSSTSLDNSVDWESENSPLGSEPTAKQGQLSGFTTKPPTQGFAFHASWAGIGFVTSAVITAFAFWLPFLLAPEAARKTYVWAYYTYDENLSHFDNTIWTYGTDYGLAVIMTAISISILRCSQRGVSDVLCFRSAGLLLSYAASVLAGGYCHQFFTTLESRNTALFRVLWTICVGTVTGASCFMGVCGTEVVQRFKQQSTCSPALQFLPVVPEVFWYTYGICITIVCALGGLSCQRPACDIFVAGITQVPSTFYLMTFFAAVQDSKVTVPTRFLGCIGFIFNAPLLPLYPLLIHYTDWSLASINTLLHSFLCVAWSTQGFILRRMIQTLVAKHSETKATKTN